MIKFLILILLLTTPVYSAPVNVTKTDTKYRVNMDTKGSKQGKIMQITSLTEYLKNFKQRFELLSEEKQQQIKTEQSEFFEALEELKLEIEL